MRPSPQTLQLQSLGEVGKRGVEAECCEPLCICSRTLQTLCCHGNASCDLATTNSHTCLAKPYAGGYGAPAVPFSLPRLNLRQSDPGTAIAYSGSNYSSSSPMGLGTNSGGPVSGLLLSPFGSLAPLEEAVEMVLGGERLPGSSATSQPQHTVSLGATSGGGAGDSSSSRGGASTGAQGLPQGIPLGLGVVLPAGPGSYPPSGTPSPHAPALMHSRSIKVCGPRLHAVAERHSREAVMGPSAVCTHAGRILPATGLAGRHSRGQHHEHTWYCLPNCCVRRSMHCRHICRRGRHLRGHRPGWLGRWTSTAQTTSCTMMR